MDLEVAAKLKLYCVCNLITGNHLKRAEHAKRNERPFKWKSASGSSISISSAIFPLTNTQSAAILAELQSAPPKIHSAPTPAEHSEVSRRVNDGVYHAATSFDVSRRP